MYQYAAQCAEHIGTYLLYANKWRCVQNSNAWPNYTWLYLYLYYAVTTGEMEKK